VCKKKGQSENPVGRLSGQSENPVGEIKLVKDRKFLLLFEEKVDFDGR